MRSSTTQRGALTPRHQQRTGCRRQEEARRLPIRLQRIKESAGTSSACFTYLSPRLLHRQAAKYFTLKGIFDPSPPAFSKSFKQRRGTYFYYNRAHRHSVRPGQSHGDRHRPTQAPSQKAPSTRPRPLQRRIIGPSWVNQAQPWWAPKQTVGRTVQEAQNVSLYSLKAPWVHRLSQDCSLGRLRVIFMIQSMACCAGAHERPVSSSEAAAGACTARH